MTEPTVVEPYWVDLADGVRLSGRLWLPGDSETRPVGAVIEYLPYRARDLTREGDDETGQHLARAGFAFLRVDIRGTGESGGVIRDEFEPSQIDDLVEVIERIAAQPWCSGSVGVRGYSWGGNVALAAAVRHPAALKGVIACCACGDGFGRDLHWHGGALGALNTGWAALYDAVVALPPDPSIVVDRWRDQWHERLEAVGSSAARWARHSTRDEYWAARSPGDAYETTDCPVYVVGGLLDGWVDEVDHVLSRFRGPRKALVGPWGHSFPHHAAPGPGVDWLDEEVRWWRHWLEGADTGLLDEPVLRCFVVDGAAPVAESGALSGEWVTETEWPLGTATRLHLGDGVLAATAAVGRLEVPADDVVGELWPNWAPADGGTFLVTDQSDDDARSLVFESGRLGTDAIVLGRPRLVVTVGSDLDGATLAARLTLVTPEGASLPLSFGVATLTEGLEQAVSIDLRFTSRRLNAGSRIRLSLSSTLWPMIAPPPGRARLMIDAGAASVLLLPTTGAVPVPLPEASAPLTAPSRDGVLRRSEGGATAANAVDGVALVTSSETHDESELDLDDPLRARWSSRTSRTMQWEGLTATVRTSCETQVSQSHFRITEVVEALEGERRVFHRRSLIDVPRGRS